MPGNIFATALMFSLLPLWGCGAGLLKEVPVSLRYIQSKQASPIGASKLEAVSIGLFRDDRRGRPAGAVGERKRMNNNVDRFHPRPGVAAAVSNIVKGYFTKRNIRVLKSGWNGKDDNIWGNPGDIVFSARILGLWFTARDSVTMAEASSSFHIELKAGSPKSGTVITKTIQIEPTSRRNIFWESEDVEKWLSATISEALDRILPDLQRRLSG